MPNNADKRTSWLLAAWPGMGSVAVLGAGHLAQQLGFDVVAELERPEHFDIQAVDVVKGVIETPRLPKSMFLRPSIVSAGGAASGVVTGAGSGARAGGANLTIFIGEAQPAQGAWAFARALLDRAQEWGVDRVVTFASMASQLMPDQEPRVHGAVTSKEMVDELERLEVSPLEGGQIGGMNGVLLGAAAERGIPGLCLMGEIPFFAAAIANPKAARAALEAFCLMTGLEVNMDELNEQGRIVDQTLTELLERMQRQEEEGEGEEGFPIIPESEIHSPGEGDEKLDEAAREHIERLFKDAEEHRSRAVHLKRELDRLGVFKEYENRFLDLFKRAE